MLIDESISTGSVNNAGIIAKITGKICETGKDLSISNDELTLVIDEAITNAIVHGNCWDSGKCINIKAYLDLKHINIEITDEGSGFQDQEKKKGQLFRNIEEAHGWGIYLIRKYCRPRWNRKGNRIQLKIDLK